LTGFVKKSIILSIKQIQPLSTYQDIFNTMSIYLIILKIFTQLGVDFSFHFK